VLPTSWRSGRKPTVGLLTPDSSHGQTSPVHGRNEQGVEASTCSLSFRALQQFFGRLIREEEIDRCPVESMRSRTFLINRYRY
jgi:hypothetical protein